MLKCYQPASKVIFSQLGLPMQHNLPVQPVYHSSSYDLGLSSARSSADVPGECHIVQTLASNLRHLLCSTALMISLWIEIWVH